MKVMYACVYVCIENKTCRVVGDYNFNFFTTKKVQQATLQIYSYILMSYFIPN